MAPCPALKALASPFPRAAEGAFERPRGGRGGSFVEANYPRQLLLTTSVRDVYATFPGTAASAGKPPTTRVQTIRVDEPAHRPQGRHPPFFFG